MKILALILSILLISCAGIEYNGQTKIFKYWRIGDQKIEGLKVQVEKDKTIVTLNNQKAANDQINEILKIVRELVHKYPSF